MESLRRLTEVANALKALFGLASAIAGAGIVIVGADALFGELPIIAQLALFVGAFLFIVALALWVVGRTPPPPQPETPPGRPSWQS